MEKIVIEVPEEYKVLAESMKAMANLVKLQVAAQRRGTVGYAQFERLVEDRSAAIERAAHEVALAELRMRQIVASRVAPFFPLQFQRVARPHEDRGGIRIFPQHRQHVLHVNL